MIYVKATAGGLFTLLFAAAAIIAAVSQHFHGTAVGVSASFLFSSTVLLQALGVFMLGAAITYALLRPKA